MMRNLCSRWLQNFEKYGCSSIRAVVGVTYLQRLLGLRKLFAYLFFLICSYAAQGATVKDEVPELNTNGLKAVVNSLRAVFILGGTVHFDKENMKKRRVKKQLGCAIVSGTI